MTTRIILRPTMFGEREQLLLELPGMSCSTFRFDSGVEALRIRNARGEIVVLPYRGQQIWRAAFDGRELAMHSMFEQPSRSTDYLRTYGAFFLHCGLTGLGAPGPQDNHPLHGELPNAAFDEASLEFDADSQVLWVRGTYRHTVAFATDYRAAAHVGIQRDSAMLEIGLEVCNLKRTPMDLMYLGHANFRPVDGARLVYSAPYTPQAVRVRRSIPAHITPAPGYAELLHALADDPQAHHRLQAGVAYEPEVVFGIDMAPDADGWTHALQVHPDGTADYASHRPDQAPRTIRWLCRTADQDALGLSFPATSGVEGYHAEKSAGRYVALAGGDSWRVDMRFGALKSDEALEKERQIGRDMGRL